MLKTGDTVGDVASLYEDALKGSGFTLEKTATPALRIFIAFSAFSGCFRNFTLPRYDSKRLMVSGYVNG